MTEQELIERLGFTPKYSSVGTLIAIAEYPEDKGFTGDRYFLSNFWDVKHTVNVAGGPCVFYSTECSFQASKVENPTEARCFVNLTPRQGKIRGKQVKLREGWDDIRDEIMYQVNMAKYTQNPVLAEKLLATGDDELVEYNTWNDKYWGVCRGEGENKLGKVLMRIRQEFKDKYINN